MPKLQPLFCRRLSFFVFFQALVLALAMPGRGQQRIWEWQDRYPTGNTLNDCHFTSPLRGWFVGNKGEIFRTTNAGQSYTRLPDYAYVDWFTVAFSDSLHGWIGGNGGRLLQTQDGGQTWSLQRVSPRGRPVQNIFFVSSKTGFRVNGGLFKTKDGGETWARISTDTFGVSSAAFSDSARGYMVENGMLKFTQNGGLTWSTTSVWLQAGLMVKVWVRGTSVFALSLTQKLFRSFGGPWEEVSPALNPQPQIRDVALVNSSIVLATNNGVLVQSQFPAWTYQSSEPIQSFFQGQNALYGVGDKGTIRRVSPSLVLHRGDMLRAVKVQFLDSLNGFKSGDATDFAFTRDGGKTWQKRPVTGFSSLNRIFFLDTLRGWINAGPGRLYKTRNGGRSWQLVGNTPTFLLSDFRFFDTLNGYASSGRWVFKTQNGGSSWTTVFQRPTGGDAKFHFFSPTQGWVFTARNLFKTQDGGQSWDSLALPPSQPNPFTYWTYGVFSPTHAVVSNGTFTAKTQDGGLTWTPLPSPGESGQTFFASPDVFWKFTSNQMHRTLDGGQTWTRFFRPFDGNVYDMVFHSPDCAWLLETNGGTHHTLRGTQPCTAQKPEVSLLSGSVEGLCFGRDTVVVTAQGPDFWIWSSLGGMGSMEPNFPLWFSESAFALAVGPIGCLIPSDTLKFTFNNPPPSFSVSPSFAPAICTNSPLTLRALNPQAFKSSWYRNGALVPDANADTLNIYQKGLYYKEHLNLETGCSTNSSTFSLDTLPTPAVVYPVQNQEGPVGGSVQFVTQSSLPGTSFQWQVQEGGGDFTNVSNGINVSGATSPTLTIQNLGPGNENQGYRCILRLGTCTDTTETGILTLTTSRLAERSRSGGVFAFPNPGGGTFSLHPAGAVSGEIRIRDMQGRTVPGWRHLGENRFDVGDLPAGVYHLEIFRTAEAPARLLYRKQ